MHWKTIWRAFIIGMIVFVNIGCDQVTKEVARTQISQHEIIPVLGDNFILTKVENTGAAMSLGSDLSPLGKLLFLQLLPVLVLLFLFQHIIRNTYSSLLTIGFGCMIGGGVGNIYDRIRFGSVTDFMHIDVGLIQTGIFNIADVSVVIGCTLVLAGMFVKAAD